MVTVDEQITQFFDSTSFAVVGASSNRRKYGNKVLRCYMQNGKHVYPVNPQEKEIEGIPCLPSVMELPGEVKSISIVTPPSVTETVVDKAIEKGIKNVWMQPGAESAHAIATCQKKGVNVIADGTCLLMVLGFRED